MDNGSRLIHLTLGRERCSKNIFVKDNLFCFVPSSANERDESEGKTRGGICFFLHNFSVLSSEAIQGTETPKFYCKALFFCGSVWIFLFLQNSNTLQTNEKNTCWVKIRMKTIFRFASIEISLHQIWLCIFKWVKFQSTTVHLNTLRNSLRPTDIFCSTSQSSKKLILRLSL